MNRSRSREIAMEIIYQMDIHSDYEVSFSERMLNQYEEKIDTSYINELVKLFSINKETVDSEITPLLKNWTFDRIGKIDLAILRLAVTEIKYLDSVPCKVTINEAVNMSKKYVDEKSGKFINGLLKHFMPVE